MNKMAEGPNIYIGRMLGQIRIGMCDKTLKGVSNSSAVQRNSKRLSLIGLCVTAVCSDVWTKSGAVGLD